MATLTADEDGVVDAALRYGRRAEAFVVDGDGTERVTKCMHDAFLHSWRLHHIAVSAHAAARLPAYIFASHFLCTMLCGASTSNGAG